MLYIPGLQLTDHISIEVIPWTNQTARDTPRLQLWGNSYDTTQPGSPIDSCYWGPRFSFGNAFTCYNSYNLYVEATKEDVFYSSCGPDKALMFRTRESWRPGCGSFLLLSLVVNKSDRKLRLFFLESRLAFTCASASAATGAFAASSDNKPFEESEVLAKSCAWHSSSLWTDWPPLQDGHPLQIVKQRLWNGSRQEVHLTMLLSCTINNFLYIMSTEEG